MVPLPDSLCSITMGVFYAIVGAALRTSVLLVFTELHRFAPLQLGLDDGPAVWLAAFVVVDFDCLMEDPRAQLERIAKKLQLPLDEGSRQGILEFSESFLRGGMRHTVYDDGDLEKAERLNPLTRDAYRWLRKLSVDEIAADDHEFRSDWERIERALALQAPSLRYLDHLVAELRRAEDRGLAGVRRRLRKRWEKAPWRFRSRA